MKQVRFIPIDLCGLQVREAGEGEQSRYVEGTPILFGVRSVNLTPWSETREVYEVMEPGCITQELIERSDVILNINHSTKVTDVLGRCRNGKGTLELGLRQNNVGAGCDFPKTTTANDTLELIRRGDITGMSFAFSDKKEGVTYENTREMSADGKEIWLRHVHKVTGLFDVSIVTHPAYEQTSVGTREASEEIERAINEQLQRECGEKERKDNECDEETDEEKAKREEEERELELQAERAREQQSMRLRMRSRRINDEILESLNV